MIHNTIPHGTGQYLTQIHHYYEAFRSLRVYIVIINLARFEFTFKGK